MKIEPGFFSRFFKNPEKTRLKPGKKPVGKGGEYAESWGSGDVVRERTTHVPARGKTRKKNPVQFFTDPLLTDPFWSEPILRRVKSTPDPDTFERYHDTPPVSMATLLLGRR